jgi:hypothetical protein
MTVLDDIIDVRRVDVQAGDVLVVRVKGNWSTDRIEQIRDQLRAGFDADVKILMINDAVELEVVRHVP